MTTYSEAKGAQPKLAGEIRRLFGVSPVAVGLQRVPGGWGFKVTIPREPSAGVDIPDHIGGIPVRFELRGVAMLLASSAMESHAAD